MSRRRRKKGSQELEDMHRGHRDIAALYLKMCLTYYIVAEDYDRAVPAADKLARISMKYLDGCVGPDCR
jgi:hypothetical protein